jgi:hydrogenase maturation factor HypF (carbamoyltransferase family)
MPKATAARCWRRPTRPRLAELGFEVLAHRQVPPNDAGISYGQAALAAIVTTNSG